jgi:hypothetical protein
MDKHVFKKTGSKLTHYAINKTMVEWRAIKDLFNVIKADKALAFDFDEAIRCFNECELPLWYGLPCQH